MPVSSPSPYEFLTIGHSNRPLAVFTDILQETGVTDLVDVRTVPKSRANPQFWGTNLEIELPKVGIAYRRIEGLGGLRGKSKTVPPEVNGFWQNQSFHNYADWALGEIFQIGLIQLTALRVNGQLPAVMCAEVLWWRCHRRIIADYLLTRGHRVGHVFDAGHVDPASLTPAAVVDGPVITYPADG